MTGTVTVNGHTAAVSTIADVALLLGFLSLTACALYFTFIVLRTLTGLARTLIALGFAVTSAVTLWGALDTVAQLAART